MQIAIFGLFLVFFILNNILLNKLDFMWSLPFIIIQGLMFVGFIEAFHQSIHAKLLPNKKLNLFFGTILGAFFGTSYQAYKKFHLDHHKYCNTPKDPEILFYKIKENKNQLSSLQAILLTPVILMNYTKIINNYENKINFIEKILIVLVYIFLAVILYEYGLATFLKHIGIPFAVFCIIEYIIGQSQHYGKKIRHEINRKDKQSINLILPYWVSFLILFTNFHSTHHAFPGCPWNRIYKKFKEEEIDTGHNLNFVQFLKLWWQKGPKYL